MLAACRLSQRLKRAASITFHCRVRNAYPSSRVHFANSPMYPDSGPSNGRERTTSSSTMHFIVEPLSLNPGGLKGPHYADSTIDYEPENRARRKLPGNISELGIVPEHMRKVPILRPPMKSGVFDVPTRPDDAERHLVTALAGALADDGETPGRWLFLVRLGDLGADRADFSFVGIQRLDVIDVPELHVFFPIRIVAALTPSPIFQRLRASLNGSFFSFLSTRK